MDNNIEYELIYGVNLNGLKLPWNDKEYNDPLMGLSKNPTPTHIMWQLKYLKFKDDPKTLKLYLKDINAYPNTNYSKLINARKNFLSKNKFKIDVAYVSYNNPIIYINKKLIQLESKEFLQDKINQLKIEDKDNELLDQFLIKNINPINEIDATTLKKSWYILSNNDY